MTKKMKAFTKSWKTSVGAVIGAGVPLLLEIGQSFGWSWLSQDLASELQKFLMAGAVLWIGLAARDSDVSSEDSGAK